MNEVRVTATGKLTDDPKVVDVNGKSKVEITIATNPQMFKDGEYKDLPAVFTTAEFWGGIATAVAAKFAKGSLVVATGVMRAKEYENREGQQKRFQYLRGEEIAEHVANRASANTAGASQSGTEYRQGADGGSGWGTHSHGATNAPYSTAQSNNPYEQNSFTPYQNENAPQRQWGQP